MPKKIKKIKQKQKQKQSQKVIVNINTTKKGSNRKQPGKSNLPSNNNKVPSVIVNLPSYNQPNNPMNNPVAQPQNINNDLLRMLNQNQEHMRNELLRRVEPQREPINVNVHNPPININNPPINITNNNPLLNNIAEPEPNELLNSIETQTEYQPNALLNSMETQTDNSNLETKKIFSGKIAPKIKPKIDDDESIDDDLKNKKKSVEELVNKNKLNKYLTEWQKQYYSNEFKKEEEEKQKLEEAQKIENQKLKQKEYYNKKQEEINEQNFKIKEMKENKEKYINILNELKSSNLKQIKKDTPIRNGVNKILKYFNSEKRIGNIKDRTKIINFLEENITFIEDKIKKEDERIRIPPKTSGNIKSIPFISSDATSTNAISI